MLQIGRGEADQSPTTADRELYQVLMSRRARWSRARPLAFHYITSEQRVLGGSLARCFLQTCASLKMVPANSREFCQELGSMTRLPGAMVGSFSKCVNISLDIGRPPQHLLCCTRAPA